MKNRILKKLMQICNRLGRRTVAGPAHGESIGQTKRRLLLRRFEAAEVRTASR